MKKVAVIMGSDSDLPVVGKAIDKLGDFGVPVEVHVMSAHRTPEAAAAFSASAADKGFGVIIAAAGKLIGEILDYLGVEKEYTADEAALADCPAEA